MVASVAARTHGATSDISKSHTAARLAQLAERKALNLVVVGSSPTVGVCIIAMGPACALSGHAKGGPAMVCGVGHGGLG